MANNSHHRKINGWKDPDAVIKTNIEFDEGRDKFVIVCENLETLDYLLNLLTYAKEKLGIEKKSVPSDKA